MNALVPSDVEVQASVMASEMGELHSPVVAAVGRDSLPLALAFGRRWDAPVAVGHPHLLSVHGLTDSVFGAVADDGHPLLNTLAVAGMRLTRHEIDDAVRHALAQHVLDVDPPQLPLLLPLLPGSTVVVVADRITDVLTVQALVACARRGGAASVHVVVPHVTPGVASTLRHEADSVVSLAGVLR